MTGKVVHTDLSKFSIVQICILVFIFSEIISVKAQVNDSISQKANNNELETLSLEDLMNIDVYTASKKSQKLSETPATTYAYTEEQIRNRGYRNLEDLLDDIPEIEIQKKSDAEYRNYYSIRGVAGNEKIVILLNGFRISAADGGPHVMGKNQSLANVKRVEIILGPASALYGVDAFTGIINIITKNGEEINGAGITTSYGNYSTTENSLVAGVSKGKVGFDILANFYHSAEPNFADIYKSDYAWYNDQYKVNGNVRLAPFLPNILVPTPIRPYETPTEAYTLNGRLTAGDFQFGYYRNMESHNTSVGTRPEYNIYAKDAIFKTTNEAIYAMHNFTSEDGKSEIQSSFSTTNSELTPDSKFLNTFTSYNYGYKYSYTKSIKIEEQFSHEFTARTSLILGASLQNFEVLPKTGDLPKEFNKDKPANLQNMHYLGTNITDKDGNNLTVYQDFYYVSYQNTGVYAQLQTRITYSLTGTFGARYDYNTRFFGSFNPRAGLVYSPNKKMNFKLLYGEASLAPSPYKSLQHYGAFIPTSDSTGVTGLFGPFWHLTNPDLKPEKIRTIEFSTSYSLETLKFSFNVFNNNVDQLIVVEGSPNQTFKGIPVAFAERPINKGKANTYGGTLKIDALFKPGGITINPYLAYSYIDGDLNDTVQLSFVAKNTIKAGMEITYKKLTISPRIISRSQSYHPTLKEADGITPASNKAYSVVNLAMRYNDIVKTGHFSLAAFVNISNLSNQKYYNISFGGEEAFAATPQDPIRINGGIALQIF